MLRFSFGCGYAALWDADTGALLAEWIGAPATDGQTIAAGNWTRTYEGLEAILAPKDLGGIGRVLLPGQQNQFGTGTYAVAVRSSTPETFVPLAIDGVVYSGPNAYASDNQLMGGLQGTSGGPWRAMVSMDFDGDYATDEILNTPHNNVMVFRMGEKVTDLPVDPARIATQGQLQASDPPIWNGNDDTCDGSDPQQHPIGWWYGYYQGDCGEHRPGSGDDWTWQSGGPGRYTHYYEKLKQVYPSALPEPDSHGAVAVRPYDLGGDHREEIVALSGSNAMSSSTPTLHIYYDSSLLPADSIPRPSPRYSLEYRMNRQTEPKQPFSFQEGAVTVERFGIRPANPSLPGRVVGVSKGGMVQLEAFLEFSDGSELDVTGHPTLSWVQDADSAPYMSSDSSGLVTVGTSIPDVSGRFQAEMRIEGEFRRSEPTYVYTSDSNEPGILRAGYQDSWLVDQQVDSEQEDRLLRVQAYVGQVDNEPVRVFMLDDDWSTMEGVELRDDGQGADDVAGDGIYHANVTSQASFDPYEDTLKYLRAFLAPIYWSLPPDPVPSGSAASDFWPCLHVNEDWEYPLLPVQEPPQPVPSEEKSYEAPRIVSMGYRGWGVPDEFLLEVEIEPSPLHPTGDVSVRASVPGIGVPVLMDPQGDDLYTLKMSIPGAAPGLYLIQVEATVVDNGVHRSVAAPKIRLHGYPTWDAGEPAPPLGFLYEPVGW